jgi:hypothetical protein
MTKTITRDLGIKIFETDVIGVYAVYKHGVFFCFTMEPSNPKWFGAAAALQRTSHEIHSPDS